ncbi:MAG: ECF transporter S component [Lachnospiraceae bacterium]|nr:ECF transporter S component [Lachnospiraceae bacterium]
MNLSTKQIAGIGLLTAIVIVLQFMGSFIHVGIFSISLVLIPIVVGASVYRSKAGAWLGLIFGLVVLASGDAGAFLAINVPGTIITVILKGTLAGLGAGAIYTAVSKLTDNKLIPVAAAAVACPVINTGIFLIGCRLFFYDTIAGWAAGAGFESVGTYFIFGLVGMNFVIELLINVVLSPIIVRIITIGKKTV